MAVDVVMPKMGESIMEGTILTWHKKPGDKVERDETILEISTDKVDTEVPSPESGTITEILYNEGDVVGVGNVIARIDTGNGSVSSTTHQTSDEPKPIAEGQKQEQATQKQVQENNPDDTPVESPSQEKAKSQSGRFYSPLVLNIAKAEGISMAELENITGTGSEGRVTKKDILAFVSNRSIAPVKPESKPIPTEPKKIITPAKKEVSLPRYEVDYNEEGLSVLEFDNIRQKMAEHMVASMSISPHVNCIAECDLTTVDKIRKEMNKDFESKEGFKISYMPFIAEATIKALKDFPLVNSVIDDSAVPFKAIMRNRINLGMAVAMDNGGLIVPVIHDSDGMNLVGLARSINDLAKRARVKKLSLDEIQGGTFTISNYGVFGNIMGTMVINQPQVAILGIGAVKKRPTVLETTEGDFVVIKPMLYLTLSFDHRLIDGALGGQFIMRIVHYLENFTV
ncbi:MAG: dihydrolipoamide acetyltransferase family protein [Ignavibacteriaceae bacterium]|jgi:2-oxoglutarate dehydrogenase E2 component (dihydrolipoamide succinyltransferase)|nr:MAG: 2-oxo acid dehydrogenase subunit E2 [Chlorobiota bacterium]KXK02445.1 MAG: 2-oxoisovalerate dehydrogenase E2 component [Chlorobi bacterium OLB4]MBV6398041.1 Dihydrolipoyllysine-residue acetyltransferase component of pyruvate dehydrogenase complex [Ignavibacteria bacterium]MCC6886489.1 2-oxo acid dehydrogenase subunit E2 [Ignavibacteriales bacterium]MCE7952435.1 2-oxo acid dehydrogenase subunit E2 [Chlorobi bacterium CHB7]MDL1886552.1 2-oxo acid dehydrogenase subunit E2 [Ignavibacteria 